MVVPAATEDTIPVPDPIVATAALLLLQVPLPVVFDNVDAVPRQSDVPPVMLAGRVFTVTTAVT